MSASQLDFYFPLIVFFYGLLVLFMMDLPAFRKIRANFPLPSPWSTPSSKGFLYFMTIFCGLWSIQNLVLA